MMVIGSGFRTGVLLLALALALATPPTRASEPSVLVETRAVREGNVDELLSAYGVVRPDMSKIVSLSFAYAGIVGKVWSQQGQRVKQGERLLTLETAPNARREYLQAVSAVAFAKQTLARKRKLFKNQLATQADVAAARKALRDARSALAALRAQGKGRTTAELRAPIDGIVFQLNVKQGQRIQADTTALVVAPEDRLVVQLGVEPEESGRITPGQIVDFTSVFAVGKTIRSRVQEVHGMINARTRLVNVLVPVPPEQTDRFIPGMRVRATIRLARQRALTVPRSALLHDSGGPYLYRISNGKAWKVYVTQGIEQGDIVAVSGPVQAGDEVVVSGNYELRNGMAVRENVR